MTVTALMRQEALVVRRTQTGPDDAYGTPTWEETTTAVLCHIQPGRSGEVADRPAGRVDYTGWFPPETNIGTSDRLVMATGLELEVAGPARQWTNPRTLDVAYLAVDLTHITDDGG